MKNASALKAKPLAALRYKHADKVIRLFTVDFARVDTSLVCHHILQRFLDDSVER